MSEALLERSKGASYRLALSGTPMWGRPRDLWMLLKVLFPDYRFGTANEFDYAYCAAFVNKWGGKENKGVSRSEELRKRLAFVMLRRTKAEIGDQLPSLTRVIRWVPAEKRATQALEKAFNNKSMITGIATGFRQIDFMTSGLQPGELITHIELPPAPAGEQLYRKVRDRASYAFALVSVAGIVAVEDRIITSAALAFGGLGPMPWRDPAVEAVLIGKAPSLGLFEAAADALLADARGFGSNDFKIPLARRTLVAALRDLTTSDLVEDAA